jgi:hypothetical protein
VRPGHVAHRVDHRQHDQAEREGNTDVGHDAPGRVVDEDGPCSGEDQGERPKAFGCKFFHAVSLRRTTTVATCLASALTRKRLNAVGTKRYRILQANLKDSPRDLAS